MFKHSLKNDFPKKFLYDQFQAAAVTMNYLSLQSQVTLKKKEHRSMMARNNLTGGEVQMESHKELLSSPSLAVGLQRQSIYLAVVNVILSLTAILGNFLILVTLRKQFSLHPPSKLLYRCLATTDLLVDLVSQPLYAIYWISIANEHWNLCRYTRDAASITGYSLCGVSLGTNDVDDGHNC